MHSFIYVFFFLRLVVVVVDDDDDARDVVAIFISEHIYSQKRLYFSLLDNKSGLKHDPR